MLHLVVLRLENTLGRLGRVRLEGRTSGLVGNGVLSQLSQCSANITTWMRWRVLSSLALDCLGQLMRCPRLLRFVLLSLLLQPLLLASPRFGCLLFGLFPLSGKFGFVDARGLFGSFTLLLSSAFLLRLCSPLPL